MHNNATWDEDAQSWLFNSSYDFPTYEKKIKAHFEAAGSLYITVLAGVCETSEATMRNWLNPVSHYYQPELHQLVEEYKTLSSQKTDEYHQQASIGLIENADAKLLQNRYDNIVRSKDILKLSKKTKAALETDDLKEQILCLKKDLAQRKITLLQFSEMVKSLMNAQDVDIKEVKEMLDKLMTPPT